MNSATQADTGLDQIEGVVVAELSQTSTTTPLDERTRAECLIRRVDMAAALARPPRRVTWRVDRFAQDGALTVLAARGGVGKSWFGIAACAAVNAGTPLGGLNVAQGPAVYVDGEMGESQMADRFRSAALAGDSFEVLDVGGLDLAQETHVEALEARLRELRPSLVVMDSLRRLAPGRRENESDDMAPLVGRLARLARDLRAAAVLIHHAGNDGGRFVRGSSAISDQADMVFGLERRGNALALSCDPERGGKMRVDREPDDRYLRLSVGEERGVVVVEAPPPTMTTPSGATSAQEVCEAAIVEALRTQPGLTKRQLAEACRKKEDTPSFRSALAALRDTAAIAHSPATGFVLVDEEMAA